MRVDIKAMRAFYRSQLGEVAARQLARAVEEMWPDLSGERVVGIGYPPPVLDAIRRATRAERTIALMPAEQGAWPWPEDAPGATAMMRETQLPLADRSADRILLLHALEDAGSVAAFLREIWRVMADPGRLLVIAANRSGLWCRADLAPFGHGRPYSSGQLRRSLESAMFTVEQEAHALYAPPSRRALSLWSSDAAERFGRRWLANFGGVVMAEASKNLYSAATPDGAVAARRLAAGDVAAVERRDARDGGRRR